MATKIKIETISDRINGLTLTLQGAVGEVARLEAEATCGGEVGRDGVAVALTLAEMITTDLRRLGSVRSARPVVQASAPEQPPLHVVAPDPQAAQVQAQELAQVRAELAEQREQLLQVLGERDQVREQVTRVAAEADRQLVAAEARRQAERDRLVAERDQAQKQLAETLDELQAEEGAARADLEERDGLREQLAIVLAERGELQDELEAAVQEAERREADLTEVSEEAERLRAKLTAERSQRTPVLAGAPTLETADEVPEAQVARVTELAQSITRRERVYQASDDGGEDAAEDLWARVTLGERLAVEVPPPPPPAPSVRRLNGTRRNGVATHARPGAQP